MNPRISEIALVAVLVVMLGLVRVYYGGSCGLVFVWKGEFSYNDTLVNLDDIMKLPKEVVKEEHPSVFYQLAALDQFEDANAHPFAYRRRHKTHPKELNANPKQLEVEAQDDKDLPEKSQDSEKKPD